MENAIRLTYRLTRKKDPQLLERLAWFGRQPYLLLDARAAQGVPVLTISRKGAVLEKDGQKLFYHPSMALLRVMNCQKGVRDRFLTASGIQEGDSVLDATLGLGTDALLAAWAVGAKGRVTALESAPVMYALVTDGLARFSDLLPEQVIDSHAKHDAWRELSAAAARVETCLTDHTDFLKSLPDKSYDVVYFDPMFRQTVEQSAAIKPVKEWSQQSALTREAVLEACRAARKRIVLKERRHSGEFARLGFSIFDHTHSKVTYGIIDV